MIRNPRFSVHGGIDCEVEHPTLGWIPYYATADDTEPFGVQVFTEAFEMGPAPHIPDDPAVILARQRAAMQCTRRQARLALGEASCAIIDAAAEKTDLPWAMRDAIKSTSEWYRTAPEIDELAWLLGLSPEDVDALFITAMAL